MYFELPPAPFEDAALTDAIDKFAENSMEESVEDVLRSMHLKVDDVASETPEQRQERAHTRKGDWAKIKIWSTPQKSAKKFKAK